MSDPICSQEAVMPVSVTFNNSRQTIVSIFWVDYQCGEVFETTLDQGKE